MRAKNMTEKRLGKYSLIRHIATGGMAEIWLAEQRGPGGFNKELVIKRILPQLADDTQMMQMFIDEARTVAHLTHPNIGQVFELGEHDGDYFIAMEFIDGMDLAEIRESIEDRDMKIPVPYAARIVSDILTALDYAHNFVDREGTHVGIVHRDISPHNVLISNDGVVKLVDFGVAKASFNSHKTETGAVKGKFAYMAPEQIESKELDHRVDIFATGTLFFELITGQKPFGEDLRAVSLIISADSTVPDPRSLRNDIPDEVVSIILKSLKRDRDDRYASAAEMDQAINEYLRRCGQAVTSRDISVMVRQLRDLPVSKPTDQLFGFEKHGVEKLEPRLTVTEKPGGNTQAAWSGTEGQDVGLNLQRQPNREHMDTAAERPMKIREGKGMTQALKTKAASEGMSLGMILLFIGLGFGVLAAVGVAAWLVIANTSRPDAEEPEVVVAEVEPEEEAAPRWIHGDGLVISIVASERAELFHEGQSVGHTPFETRLRPGRYDLELRSASGIQEVEIRVEEGRPIQRYRFDL